VEGAVLCELELPTEELDELLDEGLVAD